MAKKFNRNESIDKALSVFADMLIEKLNNMQNNMKWQQPWFTKGGMLPPVNMSGRNYNGMNSIMLMMTAEKKGYTIPVWGTFNRITSLNYDGDNNLIEPRVTINKGEKSQAVFLTSYTCVHNETGEKIAYHDYVELTSEEKEDYYIYPHTHVYNVFCIEQTNLKEARPELYAEYEAMYKDGGICSNRKDMFKFGIMDKMIEEQSWLCPIECKYQDNAYYSISRDRITYPTFEQFKDGESFYNSLLHEMAHSTGANNRLNRFPTAFSNNDQGKEELIAELTAALVCSKYGIEKTLKSDSIPYIKSWLDNIKESPAFIRTVLFDVKRASAMIENRFNEISVTEPQKA